MKKKSLLLETFLILMGPIGAYIGFYPKISCKPTQAGFWIIIALGIATGVVITRIVQSKRSKKNTKAKEITE